MLRVKEVASKLGVTERTVRRWIAEEGLPCKKVVNAIQVDPVELQQWLDSKTIIKK